jgi:hypothetical protein
MPVPRDQPRAVRAARVGPRARGGGDSVVAAAHAARHRHGRGRRARRGRAALLPGNHITRGVHRFSHLGRF